MKRLPTAKRLSIVLTGALCALALSVFAAFAQDNPPPWDVWDREAESAQISIEKGAASSEALAQVRERLDAQLSDAGEISKRATTEIERLNRELEALGPAPENGDEAPETAALRAQLNQATADARSLRGRADRVSTRAEELKRRLIELDQTRFLRRIETLGPSPVSPANWSEMMRFVSETSARVGREITQSFNAPGTRELVLSRLPLALLAVAAALFIAFGVRLFAVGALVRKAQAADGRSKRLIFGAGAAAVRLIALAGAVSLLFYGLGATGVFGPLGVAVLEAEAKAVLALVVAYAIGAALFSPQAAGLRPYNLDDRQARRGVRLTLLLGLSTAMESAISHIGEAASAPAEALSPLTFIAIVIGAYALFQLTQIARPFVNRAVGAGELAIGAQAARLVRRAAVCVAVVAPVLALIGYTEAARFLFFPTVSSLGALAFLSLVYFVIREGVESYLDDKEKNDGERLRLIPILAGFLLFCLSAPMLALIWGATWADIGAAYDRLVAGFRVGDVALSPMDFVTFALVFVIGYTLTRAAQRVLKGSVLPKTGMSRGGADALTSGVGYVGVFIAALAAITSAGLDLSNLAIVAGALSVGIGFGLQTIVNNFVSGIILLVERPINVGDWIEVGGVHGTVKKVNVRSTEIETFDRASYILPNSDLISGAVTNYTLGNTVGRVIVPVGVAYGTDTRKVEALLLEAAREHPMVLTSPAPNAYFMAFGASSLDFELRAYLRDVNWVLVTKSDLNFAIEEKLRNAGIEVPFAQRDINLKNAGEVARAFRGEDPEA